MIHKRKATAAVIGGVALAVTLGACGSARPQPAADVAPATRIVTPVPTVTVTQTPQPARTVIEKQPPAGPQVTDPWAVVAAYYGDVESQNYPEAWALLGSGMTTGQTYQQFVDGYACTGTQAVTRNWESGDEVNFDLAATDNCTGAVQSYTGTDTVSDGVIVAAHITQTG